MGFRDRSHRGPSAPRRIFAGLTSAALLIASLATAFAQTAALVPNANQQYFDANGNPLAGGSVYSYVPNTTTAKTTWSDQNELNPNTQPVVLNAGGFPSAGAIFGQGNYRQIVKDANGNLIWDGFTSAYGSATPSGANGTDTAPVGTIAAFSGFAIPTNWQLAYGQALSRTTFAQLLTALTISTTTAGCTQTSTTVSGFALTAQIPVGAAIESTCLPTSTTVASIVNSTTITVSQAATATGTFTATVFPWGEGDGVSTFNVPDLRGRVFAGADCMGGATQTANCASRLSTSFGFSKNPYTPAITGGLDHTSASTTLAAGNIPQVSTSYTPGGAISGTQAFANVICISCGSTLTGGGGSPNLSAETLTVNFANATFSGTPATITVGSASPSAATSANFGVIQPTVTTNYIIKVAPNTSGGGGVTSLGGMFGDIVCGTGLTCAPTGSPAVNTISVASSFGISGPATSTNNGLPIWNGALGSTLKDAAGGTIAGTYTWSGTQTFAPASGTLTPGILSNQTFPTCGVGCPQTAQLSANTITVVNPGWYVDNGSNTTLDTWGLSPMDTGARVNYSATGGVSYSIHTGFAVAAVNTGVSNQLVGTLSAATLKTTSAGADTAWGIIGTGDVGPGVNASAIRGIEAEMGVHPSASLATRTAFSATSFASGKGSSIDAALYVYMSGPVATGYGNGASFDNLVLLDNGGPNPALSTTACVICSRGGSSTIANLIELPSYTITGDIINVPNLHITGAGVGTITGPSGANIWTATAASGGTASLAASANGATGFDGLQVDDSSTNNSLFAGLFEASNTSTFYGQTAGNWSAINAHGSTNVGLMIGTLTAEPLILGTNNTARLTITGAGASTFSGSLTVSGASFSLSGNISAAAWTTNGIRYANPVATVTDTTSSGTVATAYTNRFSGNTIAASSATTFTNYFGSYFIAPGAGTNVTLTNAWALGADSAKFGTSNQFAVSTAGHVTVEGVTSTGATGTGKIAFDTSPSFTTPNVGAALGTSLALGNASNTMASGVQLQLSGQAGVASPAPQFAGTTMQIISANETAARYNGIEFDNYANSASGSGTGNFLIGMAIGGTLASPSATTSGLWAWVIGAGGYDGTTYSGTAAQFVMKATAQWTGSTHEMAVLVNATAPGSTSNATEAIFQNGVLIGSSGTQPGAGKLAITGIANVATTSAVCVNTSTFVLTYDATLGTCNTSDERLKVFDHHLHNALASLVALSRDEHFGYFHARGDAGRAQFGSGEHIGIGAQTVARLFPELTATGSDGMMSLAYDKLTVPIIEAIAELKADNDNLRTEIEQLRRDIAR